MESTDTTTAFKNGAEVLPEARFLEMTRRVHGHWYLLSLTVSATVEINDRVGEPSYRLLATIQAEHLVLLISLCPSNLSQSQEQLCKQLKWWTNTSCVMEGALVSYPKGAVGGLCLTGWKAAGCENTCQDKTTLTRERRNLSRICFLQQKATHLSQSVL